MFALLAVIAFVTALLLHVAGDDHLVLALALAGAALTALHLAWAWYPWRTPG